MTVIAFNIKFMNYYTTNLKNYFLTSINDIKKFSTFTLFKNISL